MLPQLAEGQGAGAAAAGGSAEHRDLHAQGTDPARLQGGGVLVDGFQEFVLGQQGTGQLLAQPTQPTAVPPVAASLAEAHAPQAQQGSTAGKQPQQIEAEPGQQSVLRRDQLLLEARVRCLHHVGVAGIKQSADGPQLWGVVGLRCVHLRHGGTDLAEGPVHRRVVAGALDRAEVQQETAAGSVIAAGADRRSGADGAAGTGWAVEAEALGLGLAVAELLQASQTSDEAALKFVRVGQGGIAVDRAIGLADQQRLPVGDDRRWQHLPLHEVDVLPADVVVQRIPVPPVEHDAAVIGDAQIQQTPMGFVLEFRQLPQLLDLQMPERNRQAAAGQQGQAQRDRQTARAVTLQLPELALQGGQPPGTPRHQQHLPALPPF